MTHPLKSWRTGSNLSQPQAGERLGVDAMTISRWERGEHLPHKKHWPTIEEKTGIAASELVSHVKQSEAAQ
jgi:transcriptional regulator with XRE-family HTH domain